MRAYPQASRLRGFTLVELLVVIAIIGTLVALLLPAVQSAREAGRRNTCLNHVKQLSLAMQSYDTSQNALPGYMNELKVPGGSASQVRRAPWVVMIFPYLENANLWDAWSRHFPNTQDYVANEWSSAFTSPYSPEIELLVCPSDPPDGEGSPFMSYVVNAGQAWECATRGQSNSLNLVISDEQEYTPNGVFFDRFRHPGSGSIIPTSSRDRLDASGQGLLKCSINYISSNDGTSKTVMVSENLHATYWCYEQLDQSETMDAKHHFGFVWHNQIADDDERALRVINGNNVNSDSLTGEVNGYPSSAHPGGVNMAFCDGHAVFLSESIEPRVYAQIMTSNHKRSTFFTTYNGDDTPDRKLPQPSDNEY